MTEQTDLYAVSTADFDTRVLAASHTRPILVDFWASWCAPCRSIAPLLEQLVVQFAGKMAVAKVDTDAEQALSQRYGIRSLPTLALFKGGAVVEQLVGVHPLQALVALVTKHLDRDSERKREEAGTSLAQGDPTTALRLLREALTEDPENTRIHPELAALLIESDDLNGAAEVLDSVPSRAINAAVRRRVCASLAWPLPVPQWRCFRPRSNAGMRAAKPTFTGQFARCLTEVTAPRWAF